MSFIATTMVRAYDTTFLGQLSGGIVRANAKWQDIKRIYLPPACSTIERHPAGGNYGNRQYLVGGHTANLVIDEQFRATKQSIRAPNSPPVIAFSTGTTPVPQVAYTRFYDEITNERSPLSDGTPFAADVTLPRTWSLPTEVPGEKVILEGTATFNSGGVQGKLVGSGISNFQDLRPGDRVAKASDLTRWGRITSISGYHEMTIDDFGISGSSVALVAKTVSRVSHVELWLSVFGSLPRMVMRVRLGTATVIETTPTLALGEAETEAFTAMPTGSFSCFYNDRQFVAGVEGHEDTVFASAIGYPERWEGLVIPTGYNERITGLFRFRDYIVVLCAHSSYRIQGYTADDYRRTVLEAEIGGIGPSVVGREVAFVTSSKGVLLFNGAFHPGIDARYTEWCGDLRQHRTAYENGVCAINDIDQTFQFIPFAPRMLQESNGTWLSNSDPTGGRHYSLRSDIWVGSYDSIVAEGGGVAQPEWVSDSYDMPEIGTYCAYARYLIPAGNTTGSFYRADTASNIYKEDPTDDELVASGRPFYGISYIVPAFLSGDPGGGAGEGKKVIQWWSYIVSELSPWRFNLWSGDDFCYPPRASGAEVLSGGGTNIVEPNHYDEFAAGMALGTTSDYRSLGISGASIRYEPKSCWVHDILTAIVGRGFSPEYVFTEPKQVRFMGFGGTFGPGEPQRSAWIVGYLE